MEATTGGMGSTRKSPLAERTLGRLMLAGGILGLITVLLPPAAERSDLGVAACAVTALALGAGFIVAASSGARLGEWALGLGALAGTALIALATWAGGFDGAGTADNEIIFLWVSLFSFYFFSLRHALLQLAAIALAYALLLSGSGAGEEVTTRFLITVGTLLVAGLVVASLRRSLQASLLTAERRARHDEATGALNRLGLSERAAAEYNRALREGTAVGFLLVDLDRFKMYNQLQGQAAGDALLRHVAAALDDATRGVDIVARLGGDEFAVLLPGAGPDEVEEIAERLIALLRESWDGGPALTTVSVGGACSPPAGHSLDDVWRAADRALDVARRTGGDRVRIARDERAHRAEPPTGSGPADRGLSAGA